MNCNDKCRRWNDRYSREDARGKAIMAMTARWAEAMERLLLIHPLMHAMQPDEFKKFAHRAFKYAVPKELQGKLDLEHTSATLLMCYGWQHREKLFGLDKRPPIQFTNEPLPTELAA